MVYESRINLRQDIAGGMLAKGKGERRTVWSYHPIESIAITNILTCRP